MPSFHACRPSHRGRLAERGRPLGAQPRGHSSVRHRSKSCRKNCGLSSLAWHRSCSPPQSDAISKSTDPPSPLRGTSGQELSRALQSPVARDSDHPLTGTALGWDLSGPSRSEAVLRKGGDARNSLRRERTHSRYGRPDGGEGTDGWFHPKDGVETCRAD